MNCQRPDCGHRLSDHAYRGGRCSSYDDCGCIRFVDQLVQMRLLEPGDYYWDPEGDLGRIVAKDNGHGLVNTWWFAGVDEHDGVPDVLPEDDSSDWAHPRDLNWTPDTMIIPIHQPKPLSEEEVQEAIASIKQAITG